MRTINDINHFLLQKQNDCLKEQNISLQNEIKQFELISQLLKFEENNHNVCSQAIINYGEDMQIQVAIEEMAELTKELIKYFRGVNNIENIIEEIADVEIMMQQLNMIFDCSTEVIEMRKKKIKRLKTRLKDE